MARKSSRALWTAHITDGSPKSKATAHSAIGKARLSGLVLGIDPSLRGMGLALIRVKDSQEFQLIHSHTLKLGKTMSFYDCLGDIAQEMEITLEKYHPDHVAVEETIYVQNFRTAQIMGAARGAALAAVTRRKLPVHEYAPLRIKQAVVGYGRASKEQVGGMVKQLLGLKTSLPLDESDAAAVAICHTYTWKEASP